MSEVPKAALNPSANESNYWAAKAQNFVRKRPGNGAMNIAGMVVNAGTFATPKITSQKAKAIGLVSRGKSPAAQTKPQIVKASNIKFAVQPT